MHLIELRITKFLSDVAKGDYKIPSDLLAKFSSETAYALKKQFETPSRGFRLSMSNVGRPLCQLTFEKEGAKGNGNILRNLYGEVVEDIALFLLHASGLQVVSELQEVELKINDRFTLKGTYDVVLNLGDGPSVWDIKSASDWAFRNKWTTFKEFSENDPFGYVDQLLLYSRALGARAGGWIVIDKSNGEIKILEVPVEDSEETGARERLAIDKAAYAHTRLFHNSISTRDADFPRFPPIEESFKRRLTGNTLLNHKCELCDFKWQCWPTLRARTKARSEARNPPLMYYIEYRPEELGDWNPVNILENPN